MISRAYPTTSVVTPETNCQMIRDASSKGKVTESLLSTRCLGLVLFAQWVTTTKFYQYEPDKFRLGCTRYHNLLRNLQRVNKMIHSKLAHALVRRPASKLLSNCILHQIPSSLGNSGRKRDIIVHKMVGQHVVVQLNAAALNCNISHSILVALLGVSKQMTNEFTLTVVVDLEDLMADDKDEEEQRKTITSLNAAICILASNNVGEMSYVVYCNYRLLRLLYSSSFSFVARTTSVTINVYFESANMSTDDLEEDYVHLIPVATDVWRASENELRIQAKKLFDETKKALSHCECTTVNVNYNLLCKVETTKLRIDHTCSGSSEYYNSGQIQEHLKKYKDLFDTVNQMLKLYQHAVHNAIGGVKRKREE